MNPVTPQHRGGPFLHPYSACSHPNSRRSSASMSWADGRTNIRSQFSDPSIPFTPTSQTSEGVHQSAQGESFPLDASAIHDPDGSYRWETRSDTVTAVEDVRYSADSQGLFPPVNLDSAVPSLNPPPDDDMLNLNLPQSDSEYMLQSVIQAIQVNYRHHPDQEAYVSELADFALSNLNRPHADPGVQAPAAPGHNQYRCLMCSSCPVFRAAAFQRHVKEQHHPKSYFKCMLCTGYRNPRRDRLKNHLLHAHSRRGRDLHPGPFPSWESWFQGIKLHCRLQAQQPPPLALGPSFPDYDGGGAGGYGGSAGYGSASHGTSPGGLSSFLGSDLNMGGPWTGASFYGPTSSRNVAPIDAPADQLNCPGIKPTQDANLKKLNNDADRNQNSRHKSRDPKAGQCDKDTGSRKGCCHHCTHGHDTCCPGCPQKYIPGYCHLCQGPIVPLTISQKPSRTTVDADHKNQSCDPTQAKSAPLAKLVHDLSKLSLECQQMVPKSDVSSKNFLSSLWDPICQSPMIGGGQPWSCMAVKFIPAAVNKYDPKYCMVASINRLWSESSYMTQQMRLSEYTLKRTASEKARQKRLSTLWARLRAVTFVLALQKDVIADKTQEERPLGNNTQLTLRDIINKNIPPFAAGSLYQLGDFCWTSPGLLGEINQDAKNPALKDPLGVYNFLRAMVTRISDPRQSFLKEYTMSEFPPFVENIF
ncbi:hypothetical protein PISL3812_00206 [Talaromyces islandicus]|uniref:Uncharacterized protein n=1 Tax=Talaromyces islandicus TaxID=28573 RepID=A0A0U1LKJ9_TALIS|nr:hypothetical protein PISL3812_00206 [Talaromyces islandicus]